MAPRKKETEVAEVAQRDPIDTTEIGDPGPVEKVAESAFITGEVELEAFMNEMLEVIVMEDANPNAVENPSACVNGVNQFFIRGQKQRVKRKYVEALARGRTTTYKQRTPDPTRPENIQMVERTGIVFPFAVVHDPNPKGPAWLEAIKNQHN